MTDYPFGDPTPTYPFGDPVGGGDSYDYAEQRAEVPRDQWDRYLIPSADGVAPATNKGRTRVSTVKKVGSSTANLQDRAERLIVQGLADPHLHELAVAAAALPEDSPSQAKVKKAALRKVAARAFDKAGGNDRRELGTKMHELIDALNRNRFGDGPEVEVPEELQPHIDAYYAALDARDLTPVPELMERVVLCPYDMGGAFDNIMRWWNPDTEAYELVVVDLKTGRTLDFSRVEFLTQLWAYANAYFMFVTTGIEKDDTGKIVRVRGYVEEMPLELRTDRAIIIHVPLDGTAEPLVLDLSGVDRYAAAQIELKRAASEAQHKYRSLGIIRPDAFEAPVLEATKTINVPVPPPEVPGGAGFADPTDHIVLNPAAHQASMGMGVGEQVTEHPMFQGGKTQAQVDREQTPVQKAQADLAASRLAKVDAMASAAGRNDDPDDGVPDPVMPLKAAQDAEHVPAPPTHDPVTGRKKRTCGHCHEPGHTQKNCLRNPTSVKFDPSLAAEPVPPQAGQPVDRPLQNDEKQLQKAVPYCLKLHPKPCGWTAKFPGKIGEWVCDVTGLPAQNAYEAGLTRMTAVPPSFGHPEGVAVEHLAPTSDQAIPTPPVTLDSPVPDYQVGDTVTVGGIEFTKHSEPPVWPTPPDMTSWGITNAQTVQDLLTHRQREIDAGRWNQAYDQQGQARYAVLVMQENGQAPPG